MQIVINIEKKHFIFLIVLFSLVGGLAVAYNADGQGGNAVNFGHSFDELDGGEINLGQVGNPGVPGIFIEATPTEGSEILHIVDNTVTDPGGDALRVEGHTVVTGGGSLHLPELVAGQPAGSYTNLCIYRAANPGEGYLNGRIYLCP